MIVKYNEYYFDYIDNIELYSRQFFLDISSHIHIPDKIFVTGRKLQVQVQEIWRIDNVIYIPNGVRISDWVQSVDSSQSPFTPGWDKVIWYYGMIEEWIDFSLLHSAIRYYPNYLFVFIWKDNHGHLQKNEFLDYKNVQFLGYIPYTDLQKYSLYFDVGIIPFVINKMTDAVSPVKFFEYLAQWINVVSTNFYEMQQFSDIARIVGTTEEFIVAIGAKKRNASEMRAYAKWYEWLNLTRKVF